MNNFIEFKDVGGNTIVMQKSLISTVVLSNQFAPKPQPSAIVCGMITSQVTNDVARKVIDELKMTMAFES